MAWIKKMVDDGVRGLRNYVATGLLVTLPIVVAAGVIIWVVNKIDGPVRDLITRVANQFLGIAEGETAKFIPPYGAGLLVTLLALIFIGAVAKNIIGRKIIGLTEKILERLPIFNRVYVAIRHVMHTFMGRDKGIFERVVLLEFPRKGVWSVGLVTSSDHKATFSGVADDILCIFLPTTPNPTSGYMMLIPEKDTVPLNLTIEEGMKMIVSGGAVVPDRKVVITPDMTVSDLVLPPETAEQAIEAATNVASDPTDAPRQADERMANQP